MTIACAVQVRRSGHYVAPSRIPDISIDSAQNFLRASRAAAVGVLERAMGESRGYDPHAAQQRCYAAISRLTGRHEMIAAARDKSLKRPEKIANSNANNNSLL